MGRLFLCKCYAASKTTAIGKRCLSTIFALSSAAGKSAIAVVRISGPNTKTLLETVTKKQSLVSKPRRIVLTSLYHPTTSELLDKAMAVWFPEDTAELYLHGGPAVISGVLQALSTVKHCRPAEPGEFSKRAFLNGKLDLTALEGVADLINAETSMQRKLALRQAGGQFYDKCQDWRNRILKAVAHLEAYIDFGEDEHLDENIFEAVKVECGDVEEEMYECVKNVAGERIKDGIRLTIVGQPNVGKSSLFNLLCEREAAIVSGLAGTTRDTLDVHLDIAGLPVLMTDTAGIRSTYDTIEKEGIRRAKLKMKAADMVIILAEAANVATAGDRVEQYIASAVDELIEAEADVLDDVTIIVALNKMDLLKSELDLPKSFCWRERTVHVLQLSCYDRQSFRSFVQQIGNQLHSVYNASASRSSMLITHSRQRTHVEDAVSHLKSFRSLSHLDPVIAAQKLRSCLFCIGKVTGHVSTEDILDVIFAEFCIGK